MDGPPKFPLPDPFSNPNWYGEIWTRYPLSPTLTQMHLAHYLKAKFNYAMILDDLGETLCNGAQKCYGSQAGKRKRKSVVCSLESK